METHLDDLFTELLKDRAYFETSNGGVTASGGEPTLQASFVGSLFKKLQSTGIHTALDTCGACQFQSLEQILPYTNLILYDLKLWEDDVHLHTTGQGNQRIIRNLISIGNLIRENKIHSNLWIRTPLIPNMTTSEENLVKIGTFLHETLGDLVERWELCAFNNLCRDKYRRLDMDWRYKDIPLMNQADLEQCGAFAKSSPFDVSKIFVTGAAKAETDFEK